MYDTCPRCGEATEVYRNLKPLDTDEARSIRLHIEFDDYYEKRCGDLGVPVDGPLVGPDGITALAQKA